jgi:hypothetical protein
MTGTPKIGATGRGSAAGYLHRIYQASIWSHFSNSLLHADQLTTKRRLKRAVKRLLAPAYWHWLAIAPAFSVALSSYRPIKSKYAIGLLRQLAGCIAFAVSSKAAPDSYFKHRLFLRENWLRRREYLFHEEIVELLPRLNAALSADDAADLADKRRFFWRCSQARLRTIPLVAEVDRGAITQHMPDVTSDLFSKPADKYCGLGATLWMRDEDGTYSNGKDARLPLSAVIARLSNESNGGPIVLQPRLVNHRMLRPICGRGLATIRIVTMRQLNGDIEVALACLRMAVGNNIADNFAAGGMAAPIDLPTGRVGVAVFKLSQQEMTHHPDSGHAIAGLQLPFWAETKRLSLAAHAEFNTMATVGWDIAICDDGPVLVEGNDVWCVDLVQMSHWRPLGETPILACLRDHFERLKPETPRM